MRACMLISSQNRSYVLTDMLLSLDCACLRKGGAPAMSVGAGPVFEDYIRHDENQEDKITLK